MLTLPEDAPFTGPQKMWLKGFLDGLSARLAQAPAQPTAAPAPGLPVTIFWGSQTGTAEALAKKLAKSLTAAGHVPSVVDMAGATVDQLSGLRHLLILTSTYGDGEPPDNALAFHTALHRADPALHSLEFAVFALGDSNYPAFCQCGRDFQQRLTALGAKPLLPLTESDIDHDANFTAWASHLSSLITAH